MLVGTPGAVRGNIGGVAYHMLNQAKNRFLTPLFPNDVTPK